MSKYREQIESILAHFSQFHEKYYAVKTFGGPSLYFHRRALEMANIMRDNIMLDSHLYWAARPFGPRAASCHASLAST